MAHESNTSMRRGTICTATGKEFRPGMHGPFDIEDIAIGLANTCRFAGQLKRGVYYSVAQHSVFVARQCYKHGSAWLAKWGLLHDAAEAYLMDVPAPYKSQSWMEEYRLEEEQLTYHILEHFKVINEGSEAEQPSTVTYWDQAVFAAEKEQLTANPEWWKLGEDHPRMAPDFLIYPWEPVRAYECFIKEYRTLFGVSEPDDDEHDGGEVSPCPASS